MERVPLSIRVGDRAPMDLSSLPSHRQVHDLPDHLRIGEGGFFFSHGKLLSAGEPWIGIRFDDINLALIRYAHINAAIIAKLHGAIGLDRNLSEPGYGFFIQ